nr:retrotransposon protein, putative, unclassified [Tanacetum cinerariifolium]
MIIASSSRVNAVGTNISIDLPPDPNIPLLEDIGIFEDSHDDEDVFSTEANFHNLDSTFQVSPIPTIIIHKDHPLEQVTRDLHSAHQTRRMTKNLEEHGLVGTVISRTDNKDLQNCLFACFLSQMEPKKISSMGELTFFLGLQVKQKKEGIFISQDKYVSEILKKFGFSDVKKASKPMETLKPLLKDEDGEEVNVHMYRSMIGSLMYLTSSRPDIIFDTVVANSTTEAEHVAASSCYGLVLWIQNQLLHYGVNTAIDVVKVSAVNTKTTSWNEFSSTMASTIICLPNNQKFNFSKYIFDNLKKNLEAEWNADMKDNIDYNEMEEQKEAEELKKNLEIVPDDEDDVFVNVTPLSSKSLTIVDYKTYKEGKKKHFQIIRANGNHQMYLAFSIMLKNFNREDLKVLWKTIKGRFKKSQPKEVLDVFLWHTLKVMFKHTVEDNV